MSGIRCAASWRKRASSRARAATVTPGLSAWESPVKVYGGSHTNRGLDGNRLLGTGVLMGSAEVRQYLMTFKNAVTIGVVGFVDAGRVFQGERLRLTTDDLSVSGGGGLVLRLLRGNTAI